MMCRMLPVYGVLLVEKKVLSMCKLSLEITNPVASIYIIHLNLVDCIR